MIATTAVGTAVWCGLFQFINASSSEEMEEKEIGNEKKPMKIILSSLNSSIADNDNSRDGNS